MTCGEASPAKVIRMNEEAYRSSSLQSTLSAESSVAP
jgi:hypothetical protein